MSNFEHLKESLDHLSRKNPLLVQNILKLNENGSYKEFVFENTKRGEFNLLYNKKLNPFLLHDPEGATKEASECFKSLDPRREVLYQFGVGLGYSFVFLKKWLEMGVNHHLVFLEPHLGVLFHLFQTEIGKKIAAHPRVHLFSFTRRNNLNYLIEYLSAFFSLLRGSYTALPSYAKAYPNLSSYIGNKLPHAQEMVSTRLIEATTAADQVFTNYLNKFPYLNGNINGSTFPGLFKKIPCIICGAGPSLKKSIPLLKKLKSKAIILAGSSAVPALIHAGITPHFGNFFDPYPRVHERFMKTTAFEMPTFHCARTFHETSRWIHGPKIYTKGSDDIPFVDWIENELGFKGTLIKEFISVTTYNTAIAVWMECSPIIYVGVDLAYTDNKHYSEGVQKDVDFNEKEESNEEGYEFDEKVLTKDIYGNPLTTSFSWKAESRFIGDIVEPFKGDTQFYNATEGGLGIKNMANISLEEVARKSLVHSYPIEEMIHAKMLPSKVKDPKIEKKCLTLFKELNKSFSRLTKIYKGVETETKELLEKNREGLLGHLNDDYVAHAEGLIAEEIAYQYYLIHHHQVIDVENLKSHGLFQELSLDAPVTLINEVKLARILTRFSRYLEKCKQYKTYLSKHIKKTLSDPWD